MFLPLGLLGGLVGPLDSRLASGGPVVTGGGTVPVTTNGGTGETGSGGVPVGTGLLEAALDGGGALLIDTGELLLLDLVLSLLLGVAVLRTTLLAFEGDK